MSDTETDEKPSGDGDSDANFDATSAAPEDVDDVADDLSDQAPADTASGKKRGASATIAWLALFLSLMTVAGVGYLLLEKYRDSSNAADEGAAVAAFSGQLKDTNQSLADLSTTVTNLGSAETQTSSMLESMRRDLDDRGQLFDSLPPRMTNIERSISSLQGVSLDARNTYLIAEAEYYLQIANAQLQLAGNPYLASLALKQADDRLLQLGDPALTDVRRAIADELAALDIMEKPDIAGLSLTLASLSRVVESLPIRQGAAGIAPPPPEETVAPGGAARAWQSVKGAVSGLVTHTPPGDAGAPLLTPSAEPLIRSNLALQLQAARLAMLRGESAVFAQSLEDADTWLETYFDIASEPVAGARATLVEIQGAYSVSSPPDISASLRLLRQYKTLLEPDE